MTLEMSTDELQFKKMMEALEEELKHYQEVNQELKMDLENQSSQQVALSNDNHYLRQKMNGMQQENLNYSHTQARLETQVYQQEQELAKSKKEIQQLSKARKDSEKKLSLELQAFEKDKVQWQQREADLYNQMRSLSVAEPRTPRTPRRRSVTTLSPFGLGDIEEQKEEQAQTAAVSPVTHVGSNLTVPKLASPSYAREAKIAQRTIKAQDKLIADLKLEVEKQKSVLGEHQTQAQHQSLRMEHFEHEIANIKQVNRSLMEDNESYQILLHEKTMNGEFMMNPILQIEDSAAVMKESTSTSSSGLNLAAELNLASDWNQKDQETQRLNEEVKTLQDTNRALQLYMNKILMKIIDNKQLEDVLSIDQPKREATIEKTPALAPQPVQDSKNTTTHTQRQQRRRTISYWGQKATPVIVPAQLEEVKRRPLSLVPAPKPERSVSSSTITSQGNGWAKALRRMSGWSTKEETEVETQPAHSRSSSLSMRHSNELSTLTEEEATVF
ncbi:hypothetical protein BY458DRAFT_512012 [Sporodiniella umbellata]|nr:hypothetical protein BY458DRAFT_512012 [Sporodiniella umbellata]